MILENMDKFDLFLRKVVRNKLEYKDGIYFWRKFKPLVDFMPFDEYLNLLAKVDIAIFNHKRQQAMGNTTILLGEII